MGICGSKSVHAKRVEIAVKQTVVVDPADVIVVPVPIASDPIVTVAAVDTPIAAAVDTPDAAVADPIV